MLSTLNFRNKLPDLAKVTILEYLEDGKKLELNFLNHQFYEQYVPMAMICKDWNPVRQGVELMLKKFSKRWNFDLKIVHFVKVSEHYGVAVPVFDNYLTEFKSLENDYQGYAKKTVRSGQFRKGTDVVEGIENCNSEDYSWV